MEWPDNYSRMPTRVFLDWSQPFLPALADWLLAAAPRLPAPDLSTTVVILPTAAAGRRLREHLADRTGETGLLSPHPITPEVLLSWATAPAIRMAGPGEEMAAWASVLLSLNPDQWRDLFPIPPVAQDIRWATGAAADLLKLRRTLEEGGHDLATAARALGPSHPEASRWQALTRLEKLAVARLETGGWHDPVSVRLAAAHAPILPEGVTRVVLAGVSDSIRLVRIALGQLVADSTAAVTVITHAPDSLASCFDAWGRPDPDIWTQREIKLPKGNDSIILTARPEDAAHRLVQSLTAAAGAPGSPAIGSADPEVAAPLCRHAAAAGIPVFDPDGLPLTGHEISWFLTTLTRLLRTGAWSAASQLMRLPAVLGAANRAARGSNHFRMLGEWDAFQAERLPQTLSQAAPLAQHWAQAGFQYRKSHAESPDDLQFPALPAVIAWLQQELTLLQRSPLPEALAALLETVYGSKTFPSAADREGFTAALTAWQDALDSVERGATAFLPDLGAADRLELAGMLVRHTRLYTPHAGEAHALHGWLELPWQEAPDLIIAGLNEGMVPDSLQGDAWLPESVRGLLDLKTNDTRLARDSYLLTTMIESRRRHGSLQLVVSRMTAAGDPLKPSRLLLRCPVPDLPDRALRLFPKEITDESGRPPAPPWQRGWSLKVPPLRPDAAIFQRLSVTAFGDYLKCPFRFYLKQVLKMEAFDPARAELDGRTVGNLFHLTMEDFHQNRALRDSQDAPAIAAFLHTVCAARTAETYGPSLTVPVVMQLEVIRNCLTKAAEIHAAESEKGWRFREVELAFPTLVRIHRTEIRGRIDLIQHHPEHGYRILDYKTAATAVKPRDAHLKPVRKKTGLPQLQEDQPRGWATVEHGGAAFEWQNLQLPLYARIMALHYDVKAVGVGYVNLPRAASEAGLEMWEDLDDPILESAWACAGEVIRRIQEGIFWPPGPERKYDDFSSLIFQDAGFSFDATALQRVQSMIASGSFQPVFSPL